MTIDVLRAGLKVSRSRSTSITAPPAPISVRNCIGLPSCAT